MNRILFGITLPIFVLSMTVAPAPAYEPVYHSLEQTRGPMMGGSLESNPVVSLNGDLTGGKSIRIRTSDRPRWIVPGDLDGDGADEALVLFDNGSLRLLRPEDKTISTRWTVEGISAQAPPVILHSKTVAVNEKIIAVSDHGVLRTFGSERGRSSRIADGFSLLTPPVAVDLDGDGTDEIVGVSDEGRFTVVTGRNVTRTDNSTVLLPDTRISVADLNGDGKLEAVAFSMPTDRFSFRRLGDETEAQGVAVFSWDGSIIKLLDEFKLDSSEAFEDLTPILADVYDGPGKEILATVTNEGEGSSIRVLSFAKRRLTEVRTSPVAADKSFIQVLGKSAFGDENRQFIITVANPSGMGDLELFRIDLAATRLVRKDSISTHIAGSRNLDLALIGDFNNDGYNDLIAPDETGKTLELFFLEKNRIKETPILVSSKRLSTNLCSGDFNGDGKGDLAAGYEDGTIVFLLGR